MNISLVCSKLRFVIPVASDYSSKWGQSRNCVGEKILMRIYHTQVRTFLDPGVRGFLCRLVYFEALESFKSGRFCVDGSFFAESETGR